MASRREEKERRRQERLEAERAERAATGRRRTLGLVVGGVLVAAAVAAIVLVVVAGGGDGGGSSGAGADERGGIQPPPVREASLKVAAGKAGCTLSNPPEADSSHIPASEPAKYKTRPPTSGHHDDVPTPDGAYRERPAPRHFVHSLQHGRVEIEYRPGLPERQQLRLKGLFEEDPAHMLLFPNRDMPYAVAAAAWTRLLGCKKYSPEVFDAIRAFKDRYRDQGPEFVP